jgi:hypothetical protein
MIAETGEIGDAPVSCSVHSSRFATTKIGDEMGIGNPPRLAAGPGEV